MTITYRKLTADDALTYRAIRLESLRLHPQSFGSSYEQQKVLPKLRFEAVLEQEIKDHFMMGAFDNGRLIGICGFIPFFPGGELENIGTIIQVYVKAAYSGQKVGLGLVRATVRAAFQQSDINEIVLGVKQGNAPAFRVYEKVGFSVYRTDEDEYFMSIRREPD